MKIFDMPIRRKLLITYLFFISVPLIVFSTISFLAVSRYYEDQVWFSANQSFDQAHTFLAAKVNAVVKASEVVYFSNDALTALSRPREEYGDNLVQQQIDMMNLDFFLNSFQSPDDVYRVTLFVPGWLSYSNQGMRFDNLDHLIGDNRFQVVFSSKEKVSWMPPEQIFDDFDVHRSVPVVSMYRRMRDFNNLSSIIGVIRVSVLETTIEAVLTKANTTRNGLVFLVNDGGTVVASSSPDAGRIQPVVQELQKPGRLGTLAWINLTAGQTYAVNARTVPNTDWRLVEAIPVGEIRYQSDRLKELLAVLVVVIGLVAWACAALITRSTTRRLSELTWAMDRLARTPGPLDLPAGARDEIGTLTESFRAMAAQIQDLLAAQYQAGQDLKSAELRALQAQINPHFLYNTLELINWQSINKGAPEIAEISRALARFYALSLNNGRDIVTIGDELAHAQTYVDIQNRRFSDRIRFSASASQSVRGLPILKILLQPLVENAILHGILERGEDHGGKVTVSARREGAVVVIRVQDDGVGMTEAQCRTILTRPPQGDRHGYGVKNIHERIRLYYGEAYGLQYRSTPGKGTTVLLRIPVQEPPSR